MPSVYVCVCVFIILLFATSSHALLQCCAKRGSGKGGEGGPQSPQCSIFEGCKEEKALQNIKQRDIAGEDDQTCCLFQCEKHAQCDGKAKIDGADKKFVAYGELESEKVRRLYLSFSYTLVWALSLSCYRYAHVLNGADALSCLVVAVL